MRVRLVVALCSTLSLSVPAFAQEPEEDLASQESGEVNEEVPAAEDDTSSSDSGDGSIKDRSVHDSRPLGVSGMLYLPWYFGIGIGFNARVEIPVVKDGFIPQINDQFSIEPSFSVAYRTRSYGWATDRLTFLDFTPAVYAMWSFHITPKFRPYAALGLGYDIGIWLNDDDYPGSDVTASFFYWDSAVGLFYNFTPSVAFRGELGAQGPKAGLSVFF